MMKKILIIGKIPPPVGGVTIHTSRLLKWLDKDKVPFEFMVLNFINLIRVPFLLMNFSCIHIHSSNPFIRFYFILLSRIYRKYSIVTIHGDINRFKSKIKNWIDKSTIQIAKKPIVLNERSFHIAKKVNPQSEIVSSFIPPDYSNEFLPKYHQSHIESMRAKYELLFCTNAYNLSYDKNGNEIYGITELINLFRNYTKFGLVFSDPSSSYINDFKKRNLIVPENIYIINGNHSFYKVMEFSDASIRNTTTDGDSLSVKESLYLNKITFATDVVSRPKGCILYKKGFLDEILNNLDLDPKVYNHNKKDENGYIRLKEIYQSCLTEN